jgi:hypothetical protein
MLVVYLTLQHGPQTKCLTVTERLMNRVGGKAESTFLLPVQPILVKGSVGTPVRERDRGLPPWHLPKQIEEGSEILRRTAD